MGSDLIFTSKQGEKDWIVQIEKMLNEEVDNNITLPASIYHVPKSLSAVKPEAYSPQLIALGPYHHLRPDLYDMERYKLAAAKKFQKQFSYLDFQSFVEELKGEEVNVRASYHKYLNFNGQTLAYIMAIDGLFLLDILHAYLNKQDMFHGTLDTSQHGKKLTEDASLRDIMMLENQIPFSVLKKILSINCSKTEVADERLPRMLWDFCKKLCPVKREGDKSSSELKALNNAPSKVLNHAHLLDLMYHMVLPDDHEPESNTPEKKSQEQGDNRSKESCLFKIGNPIDDLKNNWKLASNLNFGFMQGVKRYGDAVIKILPIVKSLGSQDSSSTSGDEEADGPLVESLKMPSVSLLHDAGVKIRKSADIKSIRFDVKKSTLYLPAIGIGVNSEVVLRNLVAYEAVAMSESLIFSRYMELMNGIIDTEEDVKLLVDKKIITSRVAHDKIARIFNGMSKSIGLTKAKNIDNTIENVNRFFDGIPKVMVYKHVKRYFFASWKLLTVLASLLLLALMAFQSFCSVYNCPRYFNTNTKMG